MALATAQDYILNALRKCGQIRPGYTSSPELMADALNEWFLMYDAFNSERTMNYSMPDYVFPITGPGHGTTGNGQSFGGTGYTIGPSGADFTAPRPVSPAAIARMNLYMTSASPGEPTRIPITVISMEEWMNIPVIQIPAVNVAITAAYDPQWPNGVIWIWPPLNGNSLELFMWGQLTPPATLATAYTAPPGYADLVVYRLAQRMYHLCTNDVLIHKVPFQWLCGQAALCAARVRRINAPKPKLRNDFDCGRHSFATSDWSLLLTGVPY